MKTLPSGLLLWTLLVASLAFQSRADDPIQPLAGTNLARGVKAVYSLAPNYGYSSGGDETDLTDGRFWQPGGPKGFWTDPGTVGWAFGRQPGAMIRLDLGRVASIDAVGFDSSAGDSQVTFPAAVLLYVSDDGRRWQYVTDLVNEAIPQNQFARHRFVAGDLHTRGRHVALYVVKGGFYAFVDEIEILEGRHSPADVSFGAPDLATDELVRDAAERGRLSIQKNATLYLIRAAREQIARTGKEAPAALDPLRQFEQLAVRRTQLEQVDYAGGLPYTQLDRDICRALGTHLGRHAATPISVWEPEGTIWAHTTSPFARPANPRRPELRADMMIGEYEPVGFNVSNNSAEPATIKLDISDLRGSRTGAVWPRSQIDPRVTTHVLASGFLYFDDALPPIQDGQVVIPPGMTRQVWLILDSRRIEAQDYAGRILLKGAGPTIELPLAATVYPVSMPANPSYRSQTWCYFTSTPARGHELAAARELERSYENAHVLHHEYIPWPKVDPATKRLVRPVTIDFSKLDEMLSYRPYVRQWLLWTGFEFGLMRLNYHGASDMPQVGTPEHETIFRQWVRQIRDHMREKGFSTDRWAFYWVDEPGDDAFLKYVVPASRLAKAVDPAILVWEDHQVSLDLLEKHPDAIDIHCCPTDYYRAHPRILQHVLAEQFPSVHYQCASSKASDPHQYYRLHHHAAIELGLGGAGMWVWGDDGGQFNDYLGDPSYGVVYATPQGPITGKRREAWREGIEDVELWRHLCAAAKASHDARLATLVKLPASRKATPEALLVTRREILQALSTARSVP